ncbi:MAG: hypothetical protein ACN6O0_10535, partial [Achromobacter spanius]
SSGSPSLKLRDSNPGGRIRRKGKRPDGRSLAAKGHSGRVQIGKAHSAIVADVAVQQRIALPVLYCEVTNCSVSERNKCFP